VNSTGGEGDCVIGGPNGARGVRVGWTRSQLRGVTFRMPGGRPTSFPSGDSKYTLGLESADLYTAGPAVIDHDLHELNTLVTAPVRTQ
jgi:hypothetical protein